MDPSIAKLVERTEGLMLSPSGKNWCDLSVEMKIECIEKMEAMERFRLGYTSDVEKALVAPLPTDFEKVKICISPNRSYDYRYVDLTGKNSESTQFPFSRNVDPKHAVPFAKYLLKTGSFGTLFLDMSPDIEITGGMDNEKIIQVKKFKIVKCHKTDLMFFLNHIPENLEHISLNAQLDPSYPIDQVLDIPKVLNAAFCRLTSILDVNCPGKCAQIFIDRDMEIGKIIYIMVCKLRLLSEFARMFEGNVVSQSNYAVRIRTNNPTKHIVLELIGQEDGFVNREIDQYTRLFIIPSSMAPLGVHSFFDPNYKFDPSHRLNESDDSDFDL